MWVPCCCAADRLSMCASYSLPLNSARSQQSVGSPLHQQVSSMHYAEAELMLMSCCPTTPQAMNESLKPSNLTSLCGLGLQLQRRSNTPRPGRSHLSMLQGWRKVIRIFNQMETVGSTTPTVSCGFAPPSQHLCVIRRLASCISMTGTPPLRLPFSTPRRRRCFPCTTSLTKVPPETNGLTSSGRRVTIMNGGAESTRSQVQSPSRTTSSRYHRITQQKLLKTATASV